MYQKSIIKEAETMIERVHLFSERLQSIEDSFEATQRLFKDLKVTTATSGHSIITSAKRIIAFGVKEDKKRRSLTEIYVDDDPTIMLADAAPAMAKDEAVEASAED
jgi:DNA recombination protein RmuC